MSTQISELPYLSYILDYTTVQSNTTIDTEYQFSVNSHIYLGGGIGYHFLSESTPVAGILSRGYSGVHMYITISGYSTRYKTGSILIRGGGNFHLAGNFSSFTGTEQYFIHLSIYASGFLDIFPDENSTWAVRISVPLDLHFRRTSSEGITPGGGPGLGIGIITYPTLWGEKEGEI